MKGAYKVDYEISRIALINAPIDLKYQDSTSLFCPPLGLMSIKAYLEQKNSNFEVILLDGMVLTTDEIINKIKKFHPNFIGISIQLLSYKNALKICRETKKSNTIVFFGGHHATQMANKIMRNRHNLVDCVICGDGEKAAFQICSGEKIGDIPGIVCWDELNNRIFSNPQILCSLDDFPNPYSAKNIDYSPYMNNLKKSSFSQKSGRYYRVYSHKGCRFRAQGKKCVFCGRADEGYRFFSVKRFFYNLYEMNINENDFIFDVGDDLSGNILWLKEAVNYVKENSVILPRFGVFGRGDEITLESAQLMHELGIVDITMGVETGDNNVLIKSGKNIKGTGVFYNAAKMLFENEIGITPSYVLGLPGENDHSLHNTIRHANVLKELSESILGYPPGEIVANLLEPIPGSNAFKILENEFPNKYLIEDQLELENMQRDYFCAVFSMNYREYEKFREKLSNAGRVINNIAKFADPQGWLKNEL